MTLSNTISVTINSVAKTLVKINTDNYGSHYRLVEATQRFDLRIRHTTERPKDGIVMDRHQVELTQTIFAASVDDPDTVIQSYAVLRVRQNDVGTDFEYNATGLADLLKATDFLTDVQSWQS
jgi:L-arabinose isomerase